MKSRNKILSAIAVVFTLFSCNTSNKPADMPNTPTSGVLKVYCEEGFTVPMKNQVYTFTEIYKNSQVEISYVNELDAIQGLYTDCCKVILLSRQLSAGELKRFEAANLFPRQTCVAKSALAFIVPLASADTSFTIQKMKDILEGRDTTYAIAFDNQNSGVTRFIKDSLLQGKPFGKNCYAAKNSLELIDQVAAKQRTIGVIDYAWLSDKDETITKEIITKVRTLAIAKEQGKTAYYPDQSNIETRDYPFCRYMYMMRRSDDFTLGTGFLSFVAGQKGQLMLLKTGLVPAFRQERVIEVNIAPLGGE